MAYKPARGSYEIDRIFPQLGRVRLRTGTHDKRIAERYEVMLEALPIETVRLIRDGKIHLRVAYDAWSAGQAHALPTAHTVRPLQDAVRVWIEAHRVSESLEKQRYWVSDRLTGTIGDVPAIVREWRRVYQAKGATFNRMRATIMAFLRDELGKRHPVYLDVAAISALPEHRKLARHPCTVAEAKQIRNALPPKWGAIWWAMCCHGLGPKEFWVDGWTVTGDTLEVHGRKRTSRERVVPLLCDIPAPIGTMAGFAEALESADVGVRPYDARRTYGRWLDDVRVTKYEHDALMGHGPHDMRTLYTSGEIAASLPEIRVRLLAHVADERRLRVAK